MTTKQRNIAIFVGIGAVTLGYLIYKRKKNNEESVALLDYISKMPSQTNLSSATQQGMDAVRGTKIDLNKLRIDNLYGSYSNPKIRNAIANSVTELYASMKGGGTDVNSFAKNLGRIKNKNTLAFVDRIYKVQYKEGLFEAMKGESVLNNVQYKVFSDATKYDFAIPFFSESHWHPSLANYFNNLPTY